MKTWKILPQKYPDLSKQLLFNRGLSNKKQIDEFLNPKLENFAADLKLEQVDKAQKRINLAIEKQELIVVYGDYDVDGIAACAILYKSLTSLGAKVLPYIPHREKEGYGLSEIGLDFARDSGASLIITVDNGIVALKQAEYAKKIGLDLIITDHHLPLEKKPDAFAIVHSIKMCGAAVAWCLIKDLINDSLVKELLQFVGIATVTDLIPLTGVSRAFVVEGLEQLNKTSNLGLLALLNECSLVPGEIGTYEIGHIIGPRLNAIGRLEHAIDALRLLCTKDEVKARKLAKAICEVNTTRQQLTVEAIDQARLLIEPNSKKKIHVLYSPNWSPGIIGLVAGRICEEYSRPTIAISVGKSFSKGSARSVNGINIVEVIRECSDILVDVGGHKGAAGFSIANENIEKFKLKMEQLLQGLPDQVEQVLEVEAKISSNQLTKSLAKQIMELEPFGLGNPQPILASYAMTISDIRTVGQGKHLKFKADGIDAIAFGMGEMENLLASGQVANLAYLLEINKFNGAQTLQLKIKDIQLV